VASANDQETAPATAAERSGAGVAAPSIRYCEALFEAPGPLQLCQLIADEIAATTGAMWAAVLRVTPEARAFEVAGSCGTVPAVLHGCHNMTPAELAAALGWKAGRPFAQFASGGSALARGLKRAAGGGAPAAFCLLAGRDALQGLAAAGWAPAAAPPPAALGTLLAICGPGAAALRHADLVADLRVSERTKSEFVATMSHELRNPLSAILGYTDLLAHGDFGTLNDEQEEVLRRAHRSASSLLDLINATLDVSRFEVGDRADQISEVDLAAILREQVEEIRTTRSRDDLRIGIGDEGELTLTSDPLKVRVAVRQVLEAAVSTNGAATLWAVARPIGDGCAIEVAPEGMTEPCHGAPVLVDLPEDGETSAVPFALFVARRLLEILGGTLALWRDDGGQRVAFRMWLPRG
jgi:signal transduction histidine kinase